MSGNGLLSKVTEFSNYLWSLGFLKGPDKSDFCNKFELINKNSSVSLENDDGDSDINSIFFKDNLAKTIVEFYSSLTEERKKLIALNVVMNYNKNKEDRVSPNTNANNENSENKKDTNNINTEANTNTSNKVPVNKKDISFVVEKLESFNFIPKKIVKKNNNISKVKNKNKADHIVKKNENQNNGNSGGDHLSFNNFMNQGKNTKRNVSSQRPKSKIANKKEKEKENINENCSFQPNINKRKRKTTKDKNEESVFNRLYTQKSKGKEKDIEDIKKERDKENIFQPNFEKNKKIKKKLSRKNFEDRLAQTAEKKKQRAQKLKEEEEKEFKEKFPFRPKRANSFNRSFTSTRSKNNISISSDSLYQRLYDDNKKNKIKYEESLKQIMDEIKDRANHPILKHNNINYIKQRRSNRFNQGKNNFNSNKDHSHVIKSKKIFLPYYQNEEKKEANKIYEFKRIEELYDEYKKLKNEFNALSNNNNNIDNKTDGVPSNNNNKCSKDEKEDKKEVNQTDDVQKPNINEKEV